MNVKYEVLDSCGNFVVARRYVEQDGKWVSNSWDRLMTTEQVACLSRSCLAQCLDFKKTHGTIQKWLGSLAKTHQKRLAKIKNQVDELTREYSERESTLKEIEKILG